MERIKTNKFSLEEKYYDIMYHAQRYEAWQNDESIDEKVRLFYMAKIAMEVYTIMTCSAMSHEKLKFVLSELDDFGFEISLCELLKNANHFVKEEGGEEEDD